MSSSSSSSSSGLPLEQCPLTDGLWTDQNVQQAGARSTQHSGRPDGVRQPQMDWRSGTVPVADGGGRSTASSDTTDSLDDAMSLDQTPRATFPPGKRRQSCIGATSVNKTTAESWRSGGSKADGKMNSAVVAASDEINADAQTATKSAGEQHSSSFDLGMTQPGTLASWRRSSDKAASRSAPEVVSDTSGEGSCGYGTAADCSAATTAVSGNYAVPLSSSEDRHFTVGVADDVVGKSQQRNEDSMTSSSRHHHQQLYSRRFRGTYSLCETLTN